MLTRLFVVLAGITSLAVVIRGAIVFDGLCFLAIVFVICAWVTYLLSEAARRHESARRGR